MTRGFGVAEKSDRELRVGRYASEHGAAMSRHKVSKLLDREAEELTA